MGVPEGRSIAWDADGGVLWDEDWRAGEIVEARIPHPTAGSRGMSAARIESIRALLRAEQLRRDG